MHVCIQYAAQLHLWKKTGEVPADSYRQIAKTNKRKHERAGRPTTLEAEAYGIGAKQPTDPITNQCGHSSWLYVYGSTSVCTACPMIRIIVLRRLRTSFLEKVVP